MAVNSRSAGSRRWSSPTPVTSRRCSPASTWTSSSTCAAEEIGLARAAVRPRAPSRRGRIASPRRVSSWPCRSPDVVATCRDKLAWPSRSRATTLAVPRTSLEPEEAAGVDPSRCGRRVFVKPRFGTGSIATTVDDRGRRGRRAASQGQPRTWSTYLHGIGDGRTATSWSRRRGRQEYGLTVVNDLPRRFRAGARDRKSGDAGRETDVAEVVADSRACGGSPTRRGARHVGVLTSTCSSTATSCPCSTSIPCLGGNYPFVDLAGADPPLAYVRWVLGEDAPTEVFAVAWVRSGEGGRSTVAPG